MPASRTVVVDTLPLRIDGLLPRIARLRDEYYQPLDDPSAFLRRLREMRPAADLFSFVQALDEPEPGHRFVMQHDEMAVLKVTSFRAWMDRQIRFKARNKLRKSIRAGIETRVVAFDDLLLEGMRRIHDESPLRQGQPNRHYGKDIETLRREHGSFIERSEFIGAYLGDELIGFAKLTHGPRYSILMNILALIAQRDKAPSNALIAKAIDCVAARGIPLLNYGIWGRRGLNEFKVSNAFERVLVPRYFVPLSPLGTLALKLGLQRDWKQRLPEPWICVLADWRGRWNKRRLAGIQGSASILPSGAAPTRPDTDR